MALLTVEHLNFTYPHQAAPAIRDVSFTVEKGDFVAVCGATGSGKSTLLRLFKPELAPRGEISGEIRLAGDLLGDTAPSIGYVTQRPEQQTVTDTVWHELAFGLENRNLPRSAMARRVAEIAAYFGIEGWYERKVADLSGGQKQILGLAAVMVTDPEILILDEPTSQLDPITAADFIITLQKLNRELGLTVLLIEHRLEEVIPVCNRLLVLEEGALLYNDAPRAVIPQLSDRPALLQAMPAAARLYHAVEADGACPLDIREGRRFIESHFSNAVREREIPRHSPAGAPALEMESVWLRYERDLPDVLRDQTLTVYEGEIFCLLGGNGSGKTTTLSAAAGLIKPYAGRINLFGKKISDYKNHSLYRECVALLPQDVQTVFLHETVREELAGAETVVASLPFDITALYDRHPYDLSGGEQQLVALARVLATRPRLLLMDEPTKGLDAGAKRELIRILRELQAIGVTVLAVTHDVEFAALCADRCGLLFRGELISADPTDTFFSGNQFYTTAAARMTKGYYSGVVTVEQAAALCRLNGSKEESAL